MCGADVLIASKNTVTNLKQSLARSRVGDSWFRSVSLGGKPSVGT